MNEPNTRDYNIALYGPQIIEAMERGCSLRTAAKLAGLRHITICRWVRDGELSPDSLAGDFARRVRKAQGQIIAEAEDLHREARREGNTAAIQWWLERVDRRTYGASGTERGDDDEADDVPEDNGATDDDVAAALGKP